MRNGAKLFASFVFAAIAVSLVVCSWIPRYDKLKQEKAKIVSIVKQPGALYRVSMTTSSGKVKYFPAAQGSAGRQKI